MRIDPDTKLDYKDVLLSPKRSTLTSRNEVDLRREFSFRSTSAEYFGVPIMAANMDGVGTFAMADKLGAKGLFTCLNKNYNVMEMVSYFDDPDMPLDRKECSAYTMGISEQNMADFLNVYEMCDGNIKYVCVDVANGYTQRFISFIKDLKTYFPTLIIIAGNVVTANQTEELIINGADIVKIGIGPGSVCTTRLQTGVGYPQLSAVIECADAAHGLGGHIIADGGCNTPADVVKAFAGGADFVMLGGMLSGHDEGGGEVITKVYETNEVTLTPDGFYDSVYEEKKFVKFYGMSSDTANMKHNGGLKGYRSSEGREVLVPYRGLVDDTLQDILGGIRSACTYVGAEQIKNLSKCATLIRCNDTHNRVYE